MLTNRELIEYLEQFPMDAQIVEHHWCQWPNDAEDIIWYDEESNHLLY